MPRTYWDRIEDDTLLGLPHLAQLLYLRCLRRYVDYETGIVGVTRRLSYAMFKEVLEVIRERGSTIREPRLTTSQCRIAIEQLERVALIQRVKCQGESLPLVFKLRLVITEAPQLNSADNALLGVAEEAQLTVKTPTTQSTTPATTESTPVNAESKATPTTACPTPAPAPKGTEKTPGNGTHPLSVNIHLLNPKNKKNEDHLSLDFAISLLIENGMKPRLATGRDHQQRLQELLDKGATKSDIVTAMGSAHRSTQGRPFSVFYLTDIIENCIHARHYPGTPHPAGGRNGKKRRSNTGSELIAKHFAHSLNVSEENESDG